MPASTPSAPAPERSGRMSERAEERARTLQTMRGALLMAVSIIVVGYVAFALIWLGLIATGYAHIATVVGVISLVLNVVVNVIVLFLAWITLDGLGRIEREADRVQQFMDNVYRRLR